MSCCADAPWMDPFCRLAAKPVGTKRGVNNNNNKKGIREKESLYLPSAGVMLCLSLALKETHKEKRGTSGGLCVFFQPPCVPRVSSTLVHIRLSISLSLCVDSGRKKNGKRTDVVICMRITAYFCPSGVENKWERNNKYSADNCVNTNDGLLKLF